MKETKYIPHAMNRHPPSNYGDEPPAYLDHEAVSFLSEPESPTAASRQNGATMRLLPTSGDDDGDLIGSPRAPLPSHYQSDYDDSTPYVHLLHTLSMQRYSRHIPVVASATQPHALPRQFRLLPLEGAQGFPVLWWAVQEWARRVSPLDEAVVVSGSPPGAGLPINNANAHITLVHHFGPTPPSISTLIKTAVSFVQNGHGRASFFTESDATAF